MVVNNRRKSRDQARLGDRDHMIHVTCKLIIICLFVCLFIQVGPRGTHANPWKIHGPVQAHTNAQAWIASIAVKANRCMLAQIVCLMMLDEIILILGINMKFFFLLEMS